MFIFGFMIKRIGFLVILFVIAIAFLHFYISPELSWYAQHIGFYRGSNYFLNFVNYPGGISLYLANYLMNFFRSPWHSALIISLSSIVVGLTVHQIIRLITSKDWYYFILVINTGFILFLFETYHFHLQVLLNVIICLALFYGLARVQNGYLKNVVSVLLSLTIYYVLGPWPFYLFAVCNLISIIIYKNTFNWGWFTVYLILMVLTPYLAYKYVFLIDTNTAYYKVFPVSLFTINGWKLVFFYLFYGLLPLILIAGRVISIQKKWLAYLIFVSALLASVGLVYIGREPERRNVLEIKKLATGQSWSTLIEKAKRLTIYNFMVNLEFNRALYFQGKLLENLFDYPQVSGSLSISPSIETDIETYTEINDLYFDVGYIESARRWGDEVLTRLSDCPLELHTLTKTSLIQGKYRLADKYINKLSQNPLFSEEAHTWRDYTRDTNLIRTNAELMEKRQLAPADSAFNTSSLLMLKSLLRHNPENHMAREYLLSYYLLEDEFDNFVALYNQYSKEYSKLPAICEEAFVYHAWQTKNPFWIKYYGVTKPVFDRLGLFLRTYSANKGNTEQLLQAMEPFRTTYWYYLYFYHKSKTDLSANN